MIFDNSHGGDWAEMFDDDDDEDLDVNAFRYGAFDEDAARGLGEDYFVDGQMVAGLKIYEVEYRLPSGDVEYVEVVGDSYDYDDRGNLHVFVEGKKMATWAASVWLSIHYMNSCKHQN